ncbi:MAG: hypothetical protein SFX18_06890 [Pirellulales bacterium]|nr:hypothetical protein [Pirellulales bacterium]
MSDYREPKYMPFPRAIKHVPNPEPFSRRKPVDGTAKRVEELESSGLSRLDALKRMVADLRLPPTRRK